MNLSISPAKGRYEGRLTMKSAGIIASTLGIDQAVMSEYRYQPTRTTQPIYAVGDLYFACGKRKPKDDVGQDWEANKDQFFASQNNTTMWLSKTK